MGSYIVKTLGCKANLYDSQLIEAELRKRGWVPQAGGSESEGGALLCIVNSCTVTDEADRQTRKMAARLFRDHPGAKVVVTGCGAEVDPERLAASKGIHYVIGNRDKHRLVELILEKICDKIAQEESNEEKPVAEGEGVKAQVLGATEGYAELLSRHPMEREWPVAEDSFFTPPVHLDGPSGKTRAFLKIQEGCNSFCTYCVIPYGRGPSRSIRPREVLAQVRELVGQGVREIVITGTNIGDYGTDWGETPALDELLTLILSETGLERLRVSSLDPTEITPAIIALMEREKRFCPHFHVSLQSPDSRILRLMKRRYGFEQVKECLERIAELGRRIAPVGGIFVGMDVITGFPGETSEDFERTCAALEALPWSRLHVFPYSERAGTPATRLPGMVGREERLSRARRLNELSLKRLVSLHEQVLRAGASEGGTVLESVLLERPNRGVITGYTPNYLRVVLPYESGLASSEVFRNQLVDVKAHEFQLDTANNEVVLQCNWLREL